MKGCSPSFYVKLNGKLSLHDNRLGNLAIYAIPVFGTTDAYGVLTLSNDLGNHAAVIGCSAHNMIAIGTGTNVRFLDAGITTEIKLLSNTKIDTYLFYAWISEDK